MKLNEMENLIKAQKPVKIVFRGAYRQPSIMIGKISEYNDDFIVVKTNKNTYIINIQSVLHIKNSIKT